MTIAHSDSGVSFEWAAVPRKVYQLEYSTDLQRWDRIGEITALGAAERVRYTSAGNEHLATETAYFRVRVLR